MQKEVETKKVLIVYHYFAHYRLPIMKELANENSVEFSFLSGDTSDINIEKISKKEADAAGITWTYIENKWLGNNWLWQKGLISHLNANKYHTIIFLGSPYFITTWISSIFMRLKGTKVLYWTHGVVRQGGLKDTFRKSFFKLANGLLLYSDYAKSNLVKHGFSADTMQVINNSLDYDKHLQLRSSLGHDLIAEKKKDIFRFPDLNTLLFIGRLTPQKKLVELILLLETLNEKGLKCNLLFIGDGEERKTLENEVQSRNLQDFVSFYGACHNEAELAPLIASCDLCVSPGEVGLTAIHSLSFGTPVITHDEPMFQMPEFESIEEGITGSFFKRGDSESLVQCVENWLNSNDDRELTRQNCYARVDGYYNPKFQVGAILKAI